MAERSRSVLPVALALLTLAFASQLSSAHTPAAGYQAAAARFELFQRFERPADRRHLQAEIALAKAQIASLKRLEREYEPMTRFKIGNALAVTVEQLALDRLAAELRLRTLQAELSAEPRRSYLRRQALLQELSHAAASIQ